MRVILDTDMAMGVPGSEIDDGFALALIASDDIFSLELVTTSTSSQTTTSGAASPSRIS